MIYQYQCINCAVVYDIVQGADENHEYVCPVCLQRCRRLWNVFQHKKNEPFFSYTLNSGTRDHPGKWVSGHSEFEEELRKTRYMAHWDERLGDNSTPKDEWVEARTLALEKERRESQQKIDLMREYNAKIKEGQIKSPEDS